jgi:hypothetical protein
MPITEIANAYLGAFARNEEIEGGLSYRGQLAITNLDGSVQSLDRIDHLLDQLRIQLQPQADEFLSDQGHVNFLYFLAFYVGSVAAHYSGSTAHWYQHDEIVSQIPGEESLFPYCFAYSIGCRFSGGSNDGKIFWPLVSIEDRVFSKTPHKSVAFSAKGFM